MKTLLALLGALAIAAPAAADTWNFGCHVVDADNPANPNTTIVAASMACWAVDNADGTLTSPKFVIDAPSALVCWLPQLDGTGPSGGAALMVHRCHIGDMPGTNPENRCPEALDAPLDGTEGGDVNQNMCRRFARGNYYLSVTTACAAGESCVATVEGERGSTQ